MLQLVVASGNVHKVTELQSMFDAAALGVEVLPARSLGAPPEVEETEMTFEGNARLKADGYARWLERIGATRPGALCLADDSGICVNALDGGPGVHSARFAGATATDADNNAALVSALRSRGLDASDAHYTCVLTLVRVDGAPLRWRAPSEHATAAVRMEEGRLVVVGRCHGEVRTAARGSGGFGYDPHFWVDGRARTFAELTDAQKAARSHRGAAFSSLVTCWSDLEGLA